MRRISKAEGDRIYADHLKNPAPRAKPGTTIGCAYCEDGEAAYADDLTFEFARVGERVRVTNLTGYRCRRCGTQWYDARSSRLIQEQRDRLGPQGGYAHRITGLSKGKVGLYFKEDVVREMRLRKGQHVKLIPLDRDRFMVERIAEA